MFSYGVQYLRTFLRLSGLFGHLFDVDDLTGFEVYQYAGHEVQVNNLNLFATHTMLNLTRGGNRDVLAEERDLNGASHLRECL